MSIMQIRKFPDPVLRVKTAKVEAVGPDEQKILDDMAETMYVSQGVGLAATQVGLDRQFAVVNIGDGLIKMVNPVIIRKAGAEAQEEGCLSVPHTTVKVKRAKQITVQFLNEKGDVCQLKAEGLLSRAIQHELDHLSGTMIIDHLNPIKKALAKRALSAKKRREGAR